jgi:hypothetical protein
VGVVEDWGLTPEALNEILSHRPSIRGMLMGFVAEYRLSHMWFSDARTGAVSLAGDDARVRSALVAIKGLFLSLPSASRQAILRELASSAPPIPTPRGGPLLSTIARILASRVEWSVPDIKEEIRKSGLDALPKDIYNAVGYLARRGYVRRVGYGRYLVEGGMLETADVGVLSHQFTGAGARASSGSTAAASSSERLSAS